MQVQELMTTNVLSCRDDESLERAAQVMWNADIGALPVVDAEGKLIGMITDRDICMAAYTQGCALSGANVGSAMSRQVEVCKPTDSIALAEEQLRRHQVRRLPVVDAGRLLGILSLNDLALAASNRKSAKNTGVSLDAIGISLARICEHRERSSQAAAE